MDVDPVVAFGAAMEAAGLPRPLTIIADGKIHRFHIEGDRRGSKNGWYVLHADDRSAGLFGSWRTGVRETWSARGNGRATVSDRRCWEAARKKRTKERSELRARAKSKAKRLLERSEPASPDHPYLILKDVRPHGIRQLGSRLIVPVYGPESHLRGLQWIMSDGGKRFLSGTEVRGGYFQIGTLDGTVVVCEGFATAASIREATAHAVAIAFNAGNMKPVCEALRAKLPDVHIIVAADDDRDTDGNPGITNATKAARAVGSLLAVPTFEDGEEGTDFNDLATLRGLAEVARLIDAAEDPSDWEDGQTLEQAIEGLEARPSVEDLKRLAPRLAGLDPIELDAALQGLQATVKDLGVRKSSIREQVERAREERAQEASAGPRAADRGPPPDPAIEKEAESLLRDADILSRMVEDTTRLGHQGEEVNRKMVLLSGVAGQTSRSHEEAIHLVIKGDSSTGKNELARCVLCLFPDGRVRFLTGVSEQALVYAGGRLEGVLVFQEAEGEEHGAYVIRQAMSEGWLERMTVIDGEVTVVRTYVCGSIVTTTTAVALHDESQTRVFDLHTDEGAELTRKVVDAAGRQAAGLTSSDSEKERIRSVWQTAFGKLEPEDVVIPYATQIADGFPCRLPRARRDIKRTLNLTRASAVLHQHTRERDGRGRLLASLDDYRMTYPLVQAVLGPSMSGLTEKAKAIAALQQELGEEGEGWVARTKLQKEAQARGVASEKTVRNWARRFAALGYWEDRKRDGRWEYRSTRDVVLEPISLPKPDELVDVVAAGNRAVPPETSHLAGSSVLSGRSGAGNGPSVPEGTHESRSADKGETASTPTSASRLPAGSEDRTGTAGLPAGTSPPAEDRPRTLESGVI